MAEPLSSFPVSSPAQPIPWPEEAQNIGLSPVPPAKTKTEPRQRLNDAVKRALNRLGRSWADAEGGRTQLVSRIRRKMTYLRRERPLHIVAAVALTGFLLGAALRLWRNQHD